MRMQQHRPVRSTRAAAAASAASAQRPPQHAHDVRTLSLLLLLHENLRRRTGSPLLPDGADLLDAARAAEALGCAVAIVGPTGGPSAAPTCATGARLGRTAELLYANAAAMAALGVQQAPEPGQPAILQLPDCAAAAEVAASGACAATAAAEWQPIARSEEQPGSSSGVAGQGAAPAGGGASSSAIGGSGCGSGNAGALATCSSAALIVDQLLVCPITAPNDSPVGLALLFDGWCYPDGALGRPGFPRVPPSELPDGGRLQAAADGVRQQADHVRGLKQQQGLGNQHPDVQAAVAELQRRKEQLALLEGLQAAFSDARESVVARWSQAQ